jgi:hypothetical protein
MKLLDMDVKDIKEIKPIALNEAIERVTKGATIICQNKRDFFELSNETEMLNIRRLEKIGVYSELKYYIR